MIPHQHALSQAVDRAAAWLLCAAAGAIFCAWYANLPIYANLYLLPAITPVMWIGVTLITVTLASFQSEAWRSALGSPLVLWWFGVVLLNIVWYMAMGGGETVIVTSRISALVFLALAYFAFSTSERIRVTVLRAMPWLAILACLLNAYNLLHPFAFVPAESEFAFMRRAAGIYINPNAAGAAIVLAVLISIETVPSRWRALFICVCAMGVTVTLSRGAVLVFVMVIGAMVVLGKLSRQTVVTLAIILGSLIAAVTLFLWPVISDVVGNLGNLDRLLLIMNPSDQADFSQNERVYLAEYGWAQFLESPLVGNGIGSTETWIHRSSTHNQYLQFMSDFGLAGMFIMPGLALALCIGRTRHDVVPLGIAGCVLLWSFVSHNVLTEYYWLIAIALAAAMPSAAAAPITSHGSGTSGQVLAPGAAT